ncbi:MAG: short chain dehydrogenase [Alphaproteobacteria bacterium]|nr:short chain dehydrogenase [Alphaproteobacteria bacterium]
MARNTVLIAGASGLIGRAAVEHFARQKDWHVIALSRRAPEVDVAVEHLAVDLMDKAAVEAVAARLTNVTHLVYAALMEKPGLVRGWRDREQMDTNITMLRHLFEPLSRHAAGLRHVSLFQGTKAYGVHLHPVPVPARESSPRDSHENFYWLQEDYLRERRAGSDWSFTIWRPQLVFGHANGSPMNVLAALAAYAAIRREQHLPFSWPGGASYVNEAIDARLIARALHWAAQSEAARDQIFNITNGDVFDWPSLWPALAEIFGMEIGAPKPQLLADTLPSLESVWRGFQRRHGLRELGLMEFVGDSLHYADFLFASHARRLPPPVLVSTIKLRQAGFADCIDTVQMLRELVEDMRRRGYLPAK